EARRELPFVFGGSSAATAGAASALLLPPEDAGPARRLLLLGVVAEGVSMELMKKRLGFLGEPYQEGEAGRFSKLAKGLALAGSALVAVGGKRRRSAAVAGSALVLAGEICLRWSVFKAGFASARSEEHTSELQSPYD